ncbi:CAAX amino terminal protease family [Coxiella burnetii CbuG_Q212]|nr:CAAX amino terminal protease family [Coxiella burnetii CbuG_Q212]
MGRVPFPLENFIKPRVKLMKFPNYRKITPLEKWY